MQELDIAISNIKMGTDGTKAETMREMWLAKPNYLKNVMNRTIIAADFPAKWKEGRVVLMPKRRRGGSEPRKFPTAVIDQQYSKVNKERINGKTGRERSDLNETIRI